MMGARVKRYTSINASRSHAMLFLPCAPTQKARHPETIFRLHVTQLQTDDLSLGHQDQVKPVQQLALVSTKGLA
jgi:hypothetical protein